MTHYLDQLQQRLLDWTRQAADQHWVEPALLATLEHQNLGSPEELFDSVERPLVVGLFGGTGVGKSSLLNRLARETIAHASVERPTSQAITVYVHKSVTVSRLPDDFPMERMRTTIHQRDDYRHVMWIDMPDFDSVESSHREQVDQWLPHLDVIVYVVSPERYRDDDGWRLLQRHARGHAWLFVINQWDRGDPAQRDDFRTLLQGAGFRDPLLFTTDSRADSAVDSPSHDAVSNAERTAGQPATGMADAADPQATDLAALESTITELADSQLIAQLGELGILERARALREQADAALRQMGSTDDLQGFIDRWPDHWSTVTGRVRDTARWPIVRLANDYAATRPRTGSRTALFGMFGTLKPGWLGGGGGGDDPALPDRPVQALASRRPSSQLPSPLDDDTVIERLDQGIDHYLQQAPESGLPAAALAHRLDAGRSTLLEEAQHSLSQALTHSLAYPGTRWQRTLHSAAGMAAAILPMLALAWIAVRVITGYWQSAGDTEQYLGSNFAVHSALLLGIAWLLPMVLQYRLKPSVETAAQRGLERGLEEALEAYGAGVQQHLQSALSDRERLEASYHTLWASSRSSADTRLPAKARRLLFEPAECRGQWFTGPNAPTT